MYKIVKKVLKKNIKFMFFKYYVGHFFRTVFQDINVIIKKIFSFFYKKTISKKLIKNFHKRYNSYKILNTIVYEYRNLNNKEKEKLKKKINNFHI